jgi:hypothetical protein
MKRSMILMIIIFLAGILQACQGSANQPATITPPPEMDNSAGQPVVPEVFVPISACDNFFLPLNTGTVWTFSDGSAMSVGPFEGDDAKGSTIAVKLFPDGKLEKYYIECAGGKTEIVKVATLDEDLNETGSQTMGEITGGVCESRIILPEAEKMAPGNSWQQCETACRVILDQTISIELGTFKTRRVECDDGLVRWYAPQFGLLKSCTGDTCAELIKMVAPN